MDRTNATVTIDNLTIQLVGFDTYGNYTFMGNFQNILGAVQAGAMNSITAQTATEVYSTDNDSDTSDGSLVQIKDDGATPLIKKAANASSMNQNLSGIKVSQDALIKQSNSTTQVKTSCGR